MDPEDRIEEAPASAPGTASVAVGKESPPRDARSLVDRMVAAGEWPEPALMEQIVAAGDEAVEPLLEVLRTEPEGWPEEAPLYNAIGLLSEIRPPRAIPALVDVIRRFKSETGHATGDALARFGAEGFRGPPGADPGSLDRRLPAIAPDHRCPDGRRRRPGQALPARRAPPATLRRDRPHGPRVPQGRTSSPGARWKERSRRRCRDERDPPR